MNKSWKKRKSPTFVTEKKTKSIVRLWVKSGYNLSDRQLASRLRVTEIHVYHALDEYIAEKFPKLIAFFN